MKARILVNASTLVAGGGVQVGVSFIEYASRRNIAEIDFLFVVSQSIYDNLPDALRNDKRVELIGISPARIIRGHKSRSLLKKMEKKFQPSIVYTLGLPSYTRFLSVEIGRYTNPWEIHPTSLAWSTLPWKERIVVWLKAQYRLLWAHRASYFETQTEVAKTGIVSRLKVPASRVKVIPNAPNLLFLSDDNTADPRALNDQVNIFCLAAAYRHKNLNIIPEVAACLKRQYPQKVFNFIITLPQDGRISKEIKELSYHLGVDDMIKNVGVLSMSDCIYWYNNSDVVFHPTLLEVFSATYLEAMAMSKPIVTTDLDFSHDICGDAALYYDPKSAQSAADAILSLVGDCRLRDQLIERGKLQLNKFPDPDSKHKMALDWLIDISRGMEY